MSQTGSHRPSTTCGGVLTGRQQHATMIPARNTGNAERAMPVTVTPCSRFNGQRKRRGHGAAYKVSLRGRPPVPYPCTCTSSAHSHFMQQHSNSPKKGIPKQSMGLTPLPPSGCTQLRTKARPILCSRVGDRVSCQPQELQDIPPPYPWPPTTQNVSTSNRARCKGQARIAFLDAENTAESSSMPPAPPHDEELAKRFPHRP